MVHVELKDLRMFTLHGVHMGESLAGNPCQVDLRVSFDEGPAGITQISQTIDYEKLYKIIKQRMGENTPLLETLCDDIARRIKEEFPMVSEIILSVYKLQAAIENLNGRVGVTIHKKFDD